MNTISKKVTGWAAIIAVPTFITGFYGMNVPYPFFGREVGFGISMSLMVVSMIVLYQVFRHRDWL
jgi:magnesium transporter